MKENIMMEFIKRNKEDYIDSVGNIFNSFKDSNVNKNNVLYNLLLIIKELNYKIDAEIDEKELIKDIKISFCEAFDYLTICSNKIFLTIKLDLLSTLEFKKINKDKLVIKLNDVNSLFVKKIKIIVYKENI